MSNPLMKEDIANAVAAGMDDTFWNSAEDVENEFMDVFGEQAIGGDSYQTLPMTGFGRVPKSSQAAAITYDSPIEGYLSTIRSDIYKLAARVSREAYDDERYGFLNSIPEELARSFKITENMVCAEFLQGGHSDVAANVLADGEPLFGDGTTYTHPLKNGGTDYNRPATAGAPLNKETLRAAIIDIKRTLDDRGKFRNLSVANSGIVLAVPQELEATAYGLIMSDKDPETANNTANWLKQQKIRIKVLNYQTDADMWSVFAEKSKHKVKIYRRIALDTDSDREFSTGCLIFSGYTRYIVSAAEWRFVWSSPGN
jgi:hypothetical protein